jgi:hypothetical protein
MLTLLHAMKETMGMFSVLALAAMFAAFGPAATDAPSAPPTPLSTPFTTVTPAPLPGALVSPSPSPAPTPTPVLKAFGSVTLGDTTAAVRKTLGKPFEIDPVDIGEMWRYNADGGNARLSIIFTDGAALSITLTSRAGKKSVFADPYGVILGMTVDQLTSLRGEPLTVADNGNRAYGDLAGVRWVYGFDGGEVTDINVSQRAGSPLSTPAPSAIDLTGGHDGMSIERAIIITAATSAAGTDLEYRYIKGLTCVQGGTWNIITQTTTAVGAKWIDEFDLTCSTDKSAQRFYFDVTSYAGK